MSDGNRLAIGAEYTVKVYELDQELQPPDWKMIGNIASPNSCPHAKQSDLSAETFSYCYHDAVLSGNGQVLVIGSSVVQNDNYESIANGTYDVELSYNTHKWNSTIGS